MILCFRYTIYQQFKYKIESIISSGFFDWLSDILSNVLSPTLNTYGTNFLQCLDQGPRILYTPLDLELNTPKPGIARVVETTTQTIIEGKIDLWLKWC